MVSLHDWIGTPRRIRRNISTKESRRENVLRATDDVFLRELRETKRDQRVRRRTRTRFSRTRYPRNACARNTISSEQMATVARTANAKPIPSLSCTKALSVSAVLLTAEAGLDEQCRPVLRQPSCRQQPRVSASSRRV